MFVWQNSYRITNSSLSPIQPQLYIFKRKKLTRIFFYSPTGQSRSTPQLGSASGVPFLSRRFGSARSFDNNSTTGPLQALQPLVQPVPVLRSAFGGSGRRLLNGGPNAAYFGSLQRLMPYNLEYDFAVIQERGALDSLEQDASRMQQYWGVATTELWSVIRDSNAVFDSLWDDEASCVYACINVFLHGSLYFCAVTIRRRYREESSSCEKDRRNQATPSVIAYTRDKIKLFLFEKSKSEDINLRIIVIT